MAKVQDVAKYLLSLVEEDRDELMSNLKLQKLLYYCQGFHLAMKDKPLFDEEIVAWPHGPVVPAIYDEYKNYGSNGIEIPKCYNKDSLSSSEIKVINDVYSFYGQFSAWGLRNMTHKEKPWRTTSQGNIISKDRLKDFFKTQLK